MKISNRWCVKTTMGPILLALVLILAIGAVSMVPPAFGRDRRGHYEHWRHHEHWRHYGYRPYGYYYNYPYRPYRHYHYYPAPVYAPPPVVYAPYPSPGVSFVFPLHIR